MNRWVFRAVRRLPAVTDEKSGPGWGNPDPHPVIPGCHWPWRKQTAGLAQTCPDCSFRRITTLKKGTRGENHLWNVPDRKRVRFSSWRTSRCLWPWFRGTRLARALVWGTFLWRAKSGRAGPFCCLRKSSRQGELPVYFLIAEMAPPCRSSSWGCIVVPTTSWRQGGRDRGVEGDFILVKYLEKQLRSYWG